METLIGMTEEQLKKYGYNVRIVDRGDGEPIFVTADYRPDRTNVRLKNGKVVRIDGFY